MPPGFRVTLTHPDLPSARFRCRSDESIAQAARRAGIALAVACERGGCGACRAELTAGQVHYLAPASARRRRGDGGKLYELLCRAAPLTDLHATCAQPWQTGAAPAPLSALLGTR